MNQFSQWWGSFSPWRIKSAFFSQDGEDFILSKNYDLKKPGFFVDIGSADPIRANNTYWFYLRGWRGLCVDASPDLGNLYKKHRPKDRFINAFVGKKSGNREFFIFNEPFLNTGCLKRKKYLIKKTGYKFQKKIHVPQLPLREILKQNLSESKKIDFMSLDVEEGELEVLQSNDWVSFRPRLIIMEVLNPDREKVGESTSSKFLKRLGYLPAIILPRSVIFHADS